MATTIETNLHVGNVRAINADVAPEGYIFKEWIGDVPAVDDILNPSTFVTMPNGDVTVTATYELLPPALRLIWDNINNAPVNNPASVSDWNTFFNLPISGSVFTRVDVIGNEVRLSGSANVTIQQELFVGTFSIHLLKIIDEASCVKYIEARAFSNYLSYTCTNLNTVMLPSVTYIEYEAFYACTSLATTNFDSLQEAEQFVFYYCTSLLGFNAPVATYFGEYCFSACENIITVTAPLLVAADNYCFSFTKSATYYDFPSLNTAGNSCFEMMYDTSLLTVNLPLTIAVGDRCFFGCSLLTSVYTPACITFGNNPSVDGNMFRYLEHGVLFSAEDPFHVPLGFAASVAEGLATITGSAFNATTGRFTTPNNYFTLTVPSILLTNNGGALNANLRALLYFNAYSFYNEFTPAYPSVPDWAGLPPTVLNATVSCGYNVKIVTELGDFIPDVPFEGYY